MITMTVEFADKQKETSMKWINICTKKQNYGEINLVSYRQRQRCSVDKEIKKGDKFIIKFES